jgi:hypothetical protein
MLKKFRKSVNIWLRYGQKYRGSLFDSQCILYSLKSSWQTLSWQLHVVQHFIFHDRKLQNHRKNVIAEQQKSIAASTKRRAPVAPTPALNSARQHSFETKGQ